MNLNFAYLEGKRGTELTLETKFGICSCVWHDLSLWYDLEEVKEILLPF